MGIRYSDEGAMGFQSVLAQTILARVQKSTKLPAEWVNRSDAFTVLRYRKLGHYTCHHDEDEPSIQKGMFRIATMMIVLKDATKGGETAFPGADRIEETKHWSSRD